MKNEKLPNLTSLNNRELKEINGGKIPLAPVLIAGWLAYQTYNEIIDFKNEFIEGFNEYRNKKPGEK